MLRPIRVSDFDEFEINIDLPAAVLFAMQMFKRAMAHVCYGMYQMCDLHAPKNRVVKRPDGSWVKTVILKGKVWVTGELYELSCPCVMISDLPPEGKYRIWKPVLVELRLGDKVYQFRAELAKFQKLEDLPQYDLFPVPHDDPGGHMAKV